MTDLLEVEGVGLAFAERIHGFFRPGARRQAKERRLIEDVPGVGLQVAAAEASNALGRKARPAL